VNFTREPLIETVITPKEGHKLVVRSSKGGGQEEFFVDAVEVISFGNASFFRSLEKPKCFLVPVIDYEILEVRESRMVLKTLGTERGIKIAGGRDALLKVTKEEAPVSEAEPAVALVDQRVEKRREKRRFKKKRGKEGSEEGVEGQVSPFSPEEPKEKKVERPGLIPPPSTLISETISRYKVMPLEGKAPALLTGLEKEASDEESEEEDIPF
jgi:hypothetical protein